MHTIPQAILSDFSQYIGDKFGLYFPEEKWKDLERGIFGVMKQFHFSDPIDCINWLKKNTLTQAEVEIMASHFTIGETYFFREKYSFKVLESKVLSELIDSRRKTIKFLRIWSAACSSGEEPYSIAILLHEMLKDIDDWNITILASDINLKALDKVKKGVYSEWSFREVPDYIKNKYFKKIEKNRYEILPHIKKLVIPLYLNLSEDSYPSLLNNTNAMDLIFCRNVLMYFVPKKIKKVIENLFNSLSNGGSLFIGACEHMQIERERFHSVSCFGMTFYKKDDTIKEPLENLRSTYFTPETSREWIPPPISEAIDDFQAEPELVLREPKNDENIKKLPETLGSLSRSMANQGDLSKAIDLVSEAISMDKCNEHLHYLKALILQELGLTSDAITELKKTIYLSPDFILPYFSLGNIAYSQGNVKESQHYFSIVLSLAKHYTPDDVLPGSEGLVVSRMIEIINSMNMNVSKAI